MLTALSDARGARPAAVIYRCTNLYSHFSWDIPIDYAQSTADAFPARITADEVSWHDTVHGGYYSLDRATGQLTVLFASSMGGYALHHSCRMR
jgi:hypothetical protein